MADADSTGDESTSFNRQRRDLFVVTSVILLVRLSHAHFEEVSVQGVGLKLDRPEVLFWGLWMLWAYWLLRYLQAYREYTTRPVMRAYKDAHERELHRQAQQAGKLAVSELLAKRREKLETVKIAGQGDDVAGPWVDWVAYGMGGSVVGKDKYRPAWKRRLLARIVAAFRVTFMRMTVTDYWLPVAYALTAPIVELLTRLHC
jgi:hypothetical protein